MEDDFYATLKLKPGEEVFALVIASEEENRTMLVVHNPVIITAIKSKESVVGYRLEPWLKTTREDMFVINMDNIITLSESMDDEMILMHQNFARETGNISKSNLARSYPLNITVHVPINCSLSHRFFDFNNCGLKYFF